MSRRVPTAFVGVPLTRLSERAPDAATSGDLVDSESGDTVALASEASLTRPVDVIRSYRSAYMSALSLAGHRLAAFEASLPLKTKRRIGTHIRRLSQQVDQERHASFQRLEEVLLAARNSQLSVDTLQRYLTAGEQATRTLSEQIQDFMQVLERRDTGAMDKSTDVFLEFLAAVDAAREAKSGEYVRLSRIIYDVEQGTRNLDSEQDPLASSANNRLEVPQEIALGSIALHVQKIQEHEALLDAAVEDARRAGASWAAIGRAVGINRDSAYRRWDPVGSAKHSESRKRARQSEKP